MLIISAPLWHFHLFFFSSAFWKAIDIAVCGVFCSSVVTVATVILPLLIYLVTSQSFGTETTQELLQFLQRITANFFLLYVATLSTSVESDMQLRQTPNIRIICLLVVKYCYYIIHFMSIQTFISQIFSFQVRLFIFLIVLYIG